MWLAPHNTVIAQNRNSAIVPAAGRSRGCRTALRWICCMGDRADQG